MELASGIVFSAVPTTWPELFTALASLWCPPSNVPKSTMFSCCHRTARISGKPLYKGSVSPFSETPAISPFAVIHMGALLPPPGSAPRSVKTPPLPAWNVCSTRQLEKQKFGEKGSGADVSAKPAAIPPRFKTDEPGNWRPHPGTK
jgi:hypothetical protein